MNRHLVGSDAASSTQSLRSRQQQAYTEVLPDERKQTAAGFLARACAWFAATGITVERVISDNGACYRSRDWAAVCAELGIAHKRTRPYRPQTNGKVERFHRTLADEWAYARPYTTETERRAALDPWLHMYNHHRGHTALNGLPPAASPTCQGRPPRRWIPRQPCGQAEGPVTLFLAAQPLNGKSGAGEESSPAPLFPRG